MVGLLVQRRHRRLRDLARSRRIRADAERAISQNEIDAAKTVHFDHLNVQDQPKLVWPATFALARSYTDQLARSKCLPSSAISSIRQSLDGAEKASGPDRQTALTQLATQLDGDANGSCDSPKVQKLAATARSLMAPNA